MKKTSRINKPTKIYFERLNPAVCDISKNPTPATFSFPSWWKDIPRYLPVDSSEEMYVPEGIPHSAVATIKNCPAISDSMSFGYTLYFPVDLYVDATNPDKLVINYPRITVPTLDIVGLEFSSETVSKTTRGFKSSKDFHELVIKISPLWGIKTEKGYSVWVTHPVNRNDLPFKTIDAVVDSDSFPARFPFSFFIRKDFKGVLQAGTPMAQVIPFKRENFSSEIIDVDLEDVIRISEISFSRFSNYYKKLFWTRKKFT